MELRIRLFFSFMFVLSTGLFLVKSQENTNQQSSDSECYNYDDTCRSCISQPNCHWCSQGGLELGGHNCFSIKTDLQGICKSPVENPQNSKPEITENRPLTEITKNFAIDYANLVQLHPQRFKLKLRKGVPVNITLTYRQVKDYPLDLYYLMDLSKSMLADKETLALLGKELAGTMRNLTSQFKIGFGSFVDKVMAPFVNIHQKALKQPCSDIKCATPFSFRNNLKLNADDKLFTSEVRNAEISSNLDSPEGGFDALMQAMVCEDEIGWRKNVRKIIVLSTDAQFHIAGDGKMAGVVEPNDQKCHLNQQGFYDKFDVYDYPSISQIDEVAQEKGVNIIFAVKSHQALYKDLSARIKDSAHGELTKESSNVIDLVTKVYKSITGRVEIGEKSRTADSPISLRYFSSCATGNQAVQTSACSDVAEGTTFNFEVEIEVTECVKGESWTKQIQIGTLQDTVTVEIELLCTCNCEDINNKDIELNSPSCSRNGKSQCGVCECNDGYYGKTCQCSRGAAANSDNRGKKLTSDPSKCRPEKSPNSTQVCNGRGRCECEICKCINANYHGKFCECFKGLCRKDVDSAIECSGNGRCDCNVCTCNQGWEGKYCDCRSQSYCENPPGSSSLCSEHGKCNCGKCECEPPYTGRYCDECPTCGDGRCLEFQPCVQCKIWESGPLYGNCEDCAHVEKLVTLDGPLSTESARLCTLQDESTGCYFNFTYEYIDSTGLYKFFAQDRQKCPEPINVLAISVGVAVGVVGIGVLTIVIWKLVTTIHDRREFAKFEAESKKAVWNTDNNPLYKNPTTTVANPAFAGN